MKTYGARIYPSDKKSGRVIVKQTLKNAKGIFIVDMQRETFVSLNDDSAIAAAVCNALAGELKNKTE